MSPSEAAKLLELPENATPDQLEARYNELRTRLEDKIAKAPTPGLRAKYRESLDEITTAFETLTLAADSSALPVLNKPSAVSSQPSVGSPGSREPATSSSPAHPSPKKRSGGGEFLIVAVIAVVVLAGGGWWVVKTRAEKAEQARIAAEAKAEADRVAAAAKAEADRKAEEARLAAEAQRRAEEEEKARLAAAAKAEQERLEKVMAQTSADLANLRIAWDAAEQEARRAERRLAELRSEERNLANAAKGGTSPDLLRLRAEIAAQASYHEWIEKQLGRHEAKILRAQAEAMNSARQYDEAARIVARAAAAQAALDEEIASTRNELLALGGSLSVRVSPAQAEWVLTDAYGTQRRGRGAAEVADVPWGPFHLEAAMPGYAPRWLEGILRRREPLELPIEFKPVKLRIDSAPQGAEIRLGGQAKGNTPATIEWAGDGSLELTLRLRGHNSVSKTLELVSGEDIDVGTLPLAPIPTGLVRPDFSKGPLRFVVSGQNTHNYHSTDNSNATSDYTSNTSSQSEQRWEIESPTGSVADATRVVLTTVRQVNNGQNVMHPGSVQEFKRMESGWTRALTRGGAVDPAVGAYMKDGPVEQSPVAMRTFLDRPEWWPTEPKKVGETWSVPISVIHAAGLAIVPFKDAKGDVTGRVVRLQLDDERQVADIEFTFNVSCANTASEIKMTYSSSGRVTATVDIKNGYIPALSYSVQGKDTSDAPIMLGMRLKGVTTTSATSSLTIKPL